MTTESGPMRTQLHGDRGMSPPTCNTKQYTGYRCAAGNLGASMNVATSSEGSIAEVVWRRADHARVFSDDL